jgi:uncharacterized damage-inducible protein DinB
LILRPHPDEYEPGPYVSGYLQAVEHEDAMDALETQARFFYAAEKKWSDADLDYRYQPDKWSVRQLLGHLIDTERVFAYRILALARGEQQSLPGFDETAYQAAAAFDRQSKETLFRHYELVRKGNLLLIGTFDDEALSRRGTVNGLGTSVRTLIWVLAGHERHHLNILRDRYGMDKGARRREKGETGSG